MRVLDYSFSSPQDNLAYDEVLFRLADKEQQGEALRFWESPSYFIVLGRIGNVTTDVHVGHAKQDGVPILRRTSGGGTVVQGPGCLNYTVVLSKLKRPQLNDLRLSYAWISERVVHALSYQGIKAKFCPISDMATLDDKKFSGNAQHRGKEYILHHGTILYNFDLGLISQYLHMPKDMPVYRQARAHASFVTNITIDPVLFKSHCAKAFDFPLALQMPTQQELLAVKETAPLPVAG